MGNSLNNLQDLLSRENAKQRMQSVSASEVSSFQFHDPFPETTNGLCLNDVYFPEEIIGLILSFIPPKEVLRASQVCKLWCNIIKSHAFWANIYQRETGKKPKKLPWYIYYCYFTTRYFDKNLLKNGNGQDGFKHWRILSNYGDGFRVEDTPNGTDPLPLDVPEFCKKTSCFATSYHSCNKSQTISLEQSRLMLLILSRFKPHIYASEWFAGRFDCGCVYRLWCKLLKLETSVDFSHEEFDEVGCLHVEHTERFIEQWAGHSWTKVEMTMKDYPEGVGKIVFQHEGCDTQFWKGHYGSKMAGGVVKILFDSIECENDSDVIMSDNL